MRAIDAPSWAARAKSAERIAALYCRSGLDPATRRVAEEAFRVLRYDSEAVVRRLLAECLKDAPHLPRDIAMSLATDAAEVAAPFLAHSPALGERDLIAILRDHPGPYRMAVARRQPLSEAVADALCRCGDRTVVLAVLGNEAAMIGEATLHAVLDDAGDADRHRRAVACPGRRHRATRIQRRAVDGRLTLERVPFRRGRSRFYASGRSSAARAESGSV